MTNNMNDAYGHALRDYMLGKADCYVVEREDGLVNVGKMATYFQTFEEWPELDQKMPSLVEGRILDVGCGAGRHALHLQTLGFDVVAIDKSPLGIEVAKQRGVKNAFNISIDELVEMENPSLGVFDTVIMMGHNIGLLHSFDQGKKILSRLAELTSPNARIVGTTGDVSKTDKPHHMAYQKSNLQRGRMVGQIKLRIRYEMFISDWLDYLFVSEEELREMAKGTGWKLETTMSGYGGFGTASYLAVLSKE